MDPRETPFNGRVAHVSLNGKVEAERFVEGETMQLDWRHAPMLDAPGGKRRRELLPGEPFRVLEMPADLQSGVAFGFAERDSYVGYLPAALLLPGRASTHVVAVRETYCKETPELKAYERTFTWYFGTRVVVTGISGSWSAVAVRANRADPTRDFTLYVPARHLRPIDQPFDDPVDVAELFLGTPYLWGGNTGGGIDCSGLVQAAALACGISCPGDSDQQARVFGGVALDAPARRGDLFFWKGHVALAMDDRRLIHANAHSMNVAIEGIADAIARTGASGGGPVTARGHLGP